MKSGLRTTVFGRAHRDRARATREKQSIIRRDRPQLMTSWPMHCRPASRLKRTNARALMLRARQWSGSTTPARTSRYLRRLILGILVVQEKYRR
jgi:hypothetical protein